MIAGVSQGQGAAHFIELGDRPFRQQHHDVGCAEIDIGARNRHAAAERGNIESAAAGVQIAQVLRQKFMPSRKRNVARFRQRIPRQTLHLAAAARVSLEAHRAAECGRQLRTEGERQLARVTPYIDIDTLQGQLRQLRVPIFHAEHRMANDQRPGRQVAQAQRVQ